MARGIDGRDLFKDEEDRGQFIKLLKEGLAHGRHRLYAWALLSNHYHLLIRVSDSPFSEMMRRLNSRYARYYSKKYRRRGYLFQDRYKSIVTQDRKYVEEILRYIHLNPIRSGLCKGLKELKSFPWSGHRAIMGSVVVEDKKAVHEVLRRFGRNDQNSRKAFSYVSRKAYEFPIKEIGRYLGICGPPVSMSVPQGEDIVKKEKNLNILIYPRP
jgi:putative transposase